MAKAPSERILWLDVVKGLAMLAIVYGHMFSDVSGVYYDSFYRWIYAWHVPIFAVVTGIIYGNRLSALHMRKLPHRVFAILVPYITFSIVYIAGNFCFAGASADWTWSAVLSTLELKGCAALWFLTAFLIAQALVSCCYTAALAIVKKISSVLSHETECKDGAQNLQLTVLVAVGIPLVVLYGIVSFKAFGSAEYLVLGRSIVLAFWLYVGVLCYRFFLQLPANIVLIGLFGIASYFLSRENGLRELWSVNIGQPYLYTAAVFTGSCCVIGIAKLIDRLCSAHHPLHRFLTFVGAESLMVMGIHQLGLALVEAHVDVQSIARPVYALIQIGAMVVVVGAAYLLSCYCPQLFGKKRLKRSL